MKPEVIVTTKLFPRTQERLEGAFTCYKLHEAADRAAFLKEHQVPPAAADPLLAGALAEAKGDGKHVFLWFSAPW